MEKEDKNKRRKREYEKIDRGEMNFKVEALRKIERRVLMKHRANWLKIGFTL